ncbi:MAG: hypothetical protein ACRYHQ_23775 [Janthinobacterium lividum]
MHQPCAFEIDAHAAQAEQHQITYCGDASNGTTLAERHCTCCCLQ